MGTLLFEAKAANDFQLNSLAKRTGYYGGDILITNEYPTYNPTFRSVRSDEWFVTSGSIFSSFKSERKHRTFYSGLPDDGNSPGEFSERFTNSSVFRMFTTKFNEFENIRITLDVMIKRYTSSAALPEQTFDGFKIFARCDPSNPNDKHYIAAIIRRDGKSIYQKKVAAGSTFQVGSTAFNQNTKYNLGEWNSYEIIFFTVGADCQCIVSKNGIQLFDITDTNTGSVGAYVSSGNVGIRADNMEFFFDNFKVYSYP